jgi:polyhydroxybutyrate depolymerase
MVLGLALALAGGAAACGDSRLPELGTADASVSGTDAGVSGSDAGAETGGVAKRSAGCGLSPTQAIGKYVLQMETVSVAPAYAPTYTNRVYYVRLPASYNPARAYSTVFLGPGCGLNGANPIPVQAASMDDAILVGLNGVDNCFNHDAADTPDLPYFDATLAAVEGSLCVDTSRIFVGGYSSGSWLASTIGCARGNVIRAQGTVAGGFPPSPPCTGPIAAMYVSDTDDMSNPAGTVMLALQRVLTANGCDTKTEPEQYEIGVPSPCVQYKGCMPGYPVVWCLTSGLGHSDQSGTMISTVGFWHFWSSLP